MSELVPIATNTLAEVVKVTKSPVAKFIAKKRTPAAKKPPKEKKPKKEKKPLKDTIKTLISKGRKRKNDTEEDGVKVKEERKKIKNSPTTNPEMTNLAESSNGANKDKVELSSVKQLVIKCEPIDEPQREEILPSDSMIQLENLRETGFSELVNLQQAGLSCATATEILTGPAHQCNGNVHSMPLTSSASDIIGDVIFNSSPVSPKQKDVSNSDGKIKVATSITSASVLTKNEDALSKDVLVV